MKSYLQFVTVPAGDTTGTCVLLHYDNKRYLFGHIGEGSMRAFNELGMSLRKVQKIFISGRITRDSTGGLLGTLLTMADGNAAAATEVSKKPQPNNGKPSEISDIEVYGAPNLVHSVAAARRFIFRKSTPTQVRDLEDEPAYRNEEGDWLPRVTDSNIDVFALNVKPTAQPAEEEEALEPGDMRAADVARQAIINGMFNSKWRLDTLVEKKLKDVEADGTTEIWVRNPDTKDLEMYKGPMPSESTGPGIAHLKVLVRNPWPASMVVSLPPTKQKPDAVSYVVRGKMVRGKFDREKAEELGVPPGRLFSKLTNGQSVTLEDGKVVAPDQVIGPDIRSGGFALFDLPSEEYVEPLLAKEELDSEVVMAGVTTFVWLLGPGVSSNGALQEFMRKTPEVQHLISSPDHNTDKLVACGAAQSAIKLAQVDGDFFPIPHFDNRVVPAPNFRREGGFLPKEIDQQESLFSEKNVMLAQRGLTVRIDPRREVDTKSEVPPLDTTALLTTPHSLEVMKLANEVHQSATSGPLAEELSEWRRIMSLENAEIVTLGTGSSMPSRYRNVSATLVRVPNWGSYLLDAGENTMGQLQRVYTPSELVEVMRDLRMIWISHGHADHHLGTVSVIKAWYDVVHGRNTDCPPVSINGIHNLLLKYNELGTEDALSRNQPLGEKPKYLAVAGSSFIANYLDDLAQVEDFGYSHVLPIVPLPQSGNEWRPNITIDRAMIMLNKPEKWVSPLLTPAQTLGLLGLKSMRAINVRHCKGAKAVLLKVGPNFSVAYSGDCRPSSAFAAASKGASVLVHEATFDDELKGDAMAKKHSTVQEAIAVASLMEAKSLILTHFSQRYQKVPVLDNVWGTTEEVKKRIEVEDETDSGGVAKGPGAGEDVDEIAADAEEIPEPAEFPIPPQEEVDKMDESEDQYEQRDGQSQLPPSTVTAPKQIPILFAFDYMRVSVHDMPKLKAYHTVLTKLFEEETADLEIRKAKAATNAANPKSPKRQGSVKNKKGPKMRKVNEAATTAAQKATIKMAESAATGNAAAGNESNTTWISESSSFMLAEDDSSKVATSAQSNKKSDQTKKPDINSTTADETDTDKSRELSNTELLAALLGSSSQGTENEATGSSARPARRTT